MSESANTTPPGSQEVCGETLSGKACRVIDTTGEISRQDLEMLLNQLIQENHFGIKGISDAQGNIKLGEPQLSNIQFGDTLYRLLLFPYEARIEKC